MRAIFYIETSLSKSQYATLRRLARKKRRSMDSQLRLLVLGALSKERNSKRAILARKPKTKKGKS